MDFTDLRVMRTQERLQNALLGLLEERELKAITVKEICDAAGISRNAFYQHYGYKEDLYEQMVARATEEIREALDPVIPLEGSTHVGSAQIVVSLLQPENVQYRSVIVDESKPRKSIVATAAEANL